MLALDALAVDNAVLNNAKTAKLPEDHLQPQLSLPKLNNVNAVNAHQKKKSNVW
jgi:hypothetical protein